MSFGKFIFINVLFSKKLMLLKNEVCIVIIIEILDIDGEKFVVVIYDENNVVL